VRNTLGQIILIGSALLAVLVLLPILGVIFVVVVGVLALAVLAFLAAPLLAKLPWFRDRIYVRRHGNRRSIRFGNGEFTSYQGRAGDPPENTPGQLGPRDVIDVQGREIPDED